MKTKEVLQEYWKNPDAENSPLGYLDNEITILRSKFLYEIVSKHFDIRANILEIGSNVGRNLNYLYQKGYTNLKGIEINSQAVELMSKKYSECYKNIKIFSVPIEESIQYATTNQFDLTFTMAVLEHLPEESKWVFKEMERISRNVLTIEDEKTSSWRHFPRNYKKIFNQLRQVESKRLGRAEGFYRGFKMRLFNG